MAEPIAIIAQDAPPRAKRFIYPEQFAARMVDRVKKPLLKSMNYCRF